MFWISCNLKRNLLLYSSKQRDTDRDRQDTYTFYSFYSCNLLHYKECWFKLIITVLSISFKSNCDCHVCLGQSSWDRTAVKAVLGNSVNTLRLQNSSAIQSCSPDLEITKDPENAFCHYLNVFCIYQSQWDSKSWGLMGNATNVATVIWEHNYIKSDTFAVMHFVGQGKKIVMECFEIL